MFGIPHPDCASLGNGFAKEFWAGGDKEVGFSATMMEEGLGFARVGPFEGLLLLVRVVAGWRQGKGAGEIGFVCFGFCCYCHRRIDDGETDICLAIKGEVGVSLTIQLDSECGEVSGIVAQGEAIGDTVNSGFDAVAHVLVGETLDDLSFDAVRNAWGGGDGFGFADGDGRVAGWTMGVRSKVTAGFAAEVADFAFRAEKIGFVLACFARCLNIQLPCFFFTGKDLFPFLQSSKSDSYAQSSLLAIIGIGRLKCQLCQICVGSVRGVDLV